MVWSEVKTNAWGDDLVKESISKIAAYPANFDAKFAERMPEIVAAPLREHSSKSAIKTLVKVREILGMTVNQDKKTKQKGRGRSKVKSKQLPDLGGINSHLLFRS